MSDRIAPERQRASIFTWASCLLFSVMISQPQPAGAQGTPGTQRTLKQVVVLSRHGVRSANATGNADHAADPWPVWVQPTYFLTANGQRLMEILGMGYSERYPDLVSHSCQGVYVWADNVERTIQTAQSLLEGMGCGTVPVNWLPSAKPDPLFHPLSGESADFPKPGSLKDVFPPVPGQAADSIVSAWEFQSPSTVGLQQLSAILEKLGDDNAANEFSTLETALGCKPGCVSNDPISFKAEADGSAGMSGALAIASNASEAFMLEYGDGWPPNQIAWGRLGTDASTIQRNLRSVLNLHVDAYRLVQRSATNAGMQASNLANEIVQIFNRTAKSRGPCPQSQGPCTPCPQVAEGQEICPPATAPLVFLVGHDTNIGNLGGMLGMDWDLSKANLPADDMPPGGALIFELWQDSTQTSWWVHVYFITLNLEAFPAPASCQTGASCLTVVPVTLPHPVCSGPGGERNWCTLSNFQKQVRAFSDRYFTFAHWSPQPSSTSGPRKARPPAAAGKPSGR